MDAPSLIVECRVNRLMVRFRDCRRFEWPSRTSASGGLLPDGRALRTAADPLVAQQAAGLSVSGRVVSGGVTVYEPQRTAVYRQKYRHQSVDLAGFDETTVDSRFEKIELFQ
ncbi:hypothetical protein [Burkholderia seminalis]|uniref:hypothetical protein n=1 Tax=Burkholderia seminalis TaxID=488731 RepID=UPI002655697D|nr:hypothetical protein [Burkholderia seminalis]MDN7586635.1 hypothetical protein [Burkholderia seminalis]